MMLHSREMRAALQKHMSAVQKHISPLAVSRDELLSTRLWHLWHDHVPDGDLFNREKKIMRKDSNAKQKIQVARSCVRDA